MTPDLTPYHESLMVTPCNSSQVIDRLMLGNAYSHVIYVGDGRGDYCPVRFRA